VKISKRGEYALRALIDFGLAEAANRPLLQASELALREDFPVKFLEQILMQLRTGNYIKSRRGKLGGYLLARPPENICIGQVIRLIDGPLAPISCVSRTAYERCSCPDEEHCGLRMLMLDVRSAIANILDRYTLADVLEVTLRKLRKSKMSLPFSLEQSLEESDLPTKPVKRPKQRNKGVPARNGKRTLGGLSNASLDSISRTAPPATVTKTSLKARAQARRDRSSSSRSPVAPRLPKSGAK
jgi:Rrf2 family protein